ncbi:polyketide cyclase [Streptomyces finlayi]|uniref:Polyketide cyclase n=1 Tax=Streptomyces finlayi TaxID=67296 RepID=A0A7G7BSW0_9ACTN|nr:SRPBCC family protein [Streptomyces finlayi]QNE78425.1 polyketide cyclase [Streptomyces finlayi]
MDWSHYRFTSVWDIPAPPDSVYTALERAEDYPQWWPQVRAVAVIDEMSGTARLRSFLPYELVVTARRNHRDPRSRVIEVTMTGDLEGWARWTVAARADGSRATYQQEVVVRRALMRRLAVPGRLVFRANHALMMRSGRRGLAARLRGV